MAAGDCSNFSVGASSSFIWFAARPLAELAAYDFAVLDYCVNDGLMIRSGANTLRNWEASMRAMFAELRAAGCEPLMLILPSLHTMRGNNPLRPAARALAAECRVPFLDGFELMERVLAMEPALALDDLFRDPAHLHPALSRQVGRALVEAVGKLPSRQTGLGATAPTCPVAYRLRDVTEWMAEDRLVERATSLVKRRFLLLSDGEEVACPVDPGERLVGVALDLAKSNGTLAASGDGMWLKSWTNPYFREWLGVERAMVFSILPFMGAVMPGEDGTIRISVQPDAAAKPDESWGPIGTSADHPASLCLSGLVFERDADVLDIPLPFEAAPDLLALMDAEVPRLIAEAARAIQMAK
ncbi:hypothetical protein C8P66_14125 [Humitalea rosea]|uniref:Uncharacterized protein n=1 Tax=Humitalea rosea TaxID=990373 RepID=A0A2W7HYJ7_9PROT|nr:hypothetical protein [Humitalea rosea]PZW37748.1 hypothetical protein C8P66_14125 [Humitalea rosea]